MSRYGQVQLIPMNMLATSLILLVSGMIEAAGPGVHGRVLGHNEEGKLLGAVADAKIDFQNRSGQKVGQATSAKNGYFKIDLPPGEYLYKIVASGYRTEDVGRGLRLTQNNGYAIFNLALTEGQDDPNRQPPELVQKDFGKLHGTVFEINNGTRIGVAGARIALRREDSRKLLFARSRTSVDESRIGEYEIALEVGTYRASVVAPGYVVASFPHTMTIKSGTDTKQDFELKRPADADSQGQGIRGVVSIVDSGVTPPPVKIQITTLSGSRPVIDLQLGRNITFSRDLPPGQYRVMASAEGFPNSESPPIFVMSGRYTQVNLALRAKTVPEPKTSVEVFVYTKTADAQSHTPVAGAKVTLLKQNTVPQNAKEGTTDPTGHAIFVVEEAGEYIAEAHQKGFQVGHGHGVVAIDQKHEVAIELVRDSVTTAELALAVSVIDATNKRPLANARLLAREAGQSLVEATRGLTDVKGQASLEIAHAGNYTVMAQLNGYAPGGAQTNVQNNQENRVIISLKPISSTSGEPLIPPPEQADPTRTQVSGYVAFREPTGQLRSVPGAHLTWERAAQNQRAFNQSVSTANNGKYLLELLPGHYEVRVEPPFGFAPVSEHVEVLTGKQEKYFIVQRTANVNPESTVQLIDVVGQVVTETSRSRFVSVPQAEVLFVRGSSVSKATADNDGRFMQRLPTDQYKVFVRAAKFDPLETPVEVRKGMSTLRLVLKRSTTAPPDTDLRADALLNIAVVERRVGVVDRTLPPLAGATIQISQAGRTLFSGQTNALGKYSVRVKPGSYSVIATKLGYAKAVAEVGVAGRDVTHQLVLIGGGAAGNETVHKPTITVHVTRRVGRPSTSIKPIGDPLAGAQITIMLGAKQVATGQTNAAGNFSVQLAPGNYAIKVIAKGQAPAGKTIILNERDTAVNFQLEGIPGSASAVDEVNSSNTDASNRGAEDSRSRRAPQTWYIVEHRDNSRAPWVVLGEYTSQRDAQAALFRAVERGQISGGAPAESRIRTVARAAR